MHSRGNPRLGRRLHNGKADISAGPYHHIGRKLPQNGPGFPWGPHEIAHGNQIVPDLRRAKGPVKAGDMDRAERIARLGNQILLQSPFRTDQNKNSVAGSFSCISCASAMAGLTCPARPAAGKNHAPAGAGSIPLISYPAFVGFICRDTDRTIPISASCMERAVPP